MADERISGGDEEFDKEFAAEQPETPANDTPPEGDAPPASDKKEEEEVEEEPEGLVVPIRKSTAQHIIARQSRTIEKLRSKDGEEVVPPSSDEDDETDETPVAPKRSTVAEEVEAQLQPIINTFISSTDEAELKDLFSTDPESKKFEKRIRAYMQDPHWKAIPPAAIYHHLAFSNTSGVKEKQKKREVADIEAGQVQGGGSQHREMAPTGDIPTADDMDNMDDAEFENLQNKARSGGFITR